MAGIAEFADVNRCVYEDQRWFEQNYGDQDLGERVTVTRKSPGINDYDANHSVNRRVYAPATMPNRNALESAKKRNVPTSSS